MRNGTCTFALKYCLKCWSWGLYKLLKHNPQFRNHSSQAMTSYSRSTEVSQHPTWFHHPNLTSRKCFTDLKCRINDIVNLNKNCTICTMSIEYSAHNTNLFLYSEHGFIHDIFILLNTMWCGYTQVILTQKIELIPDACQNLRKLKLRFEN